MATDNSNSGGDKKSQPSNGQLAPLSDQGTRTYSDGQKGVFDSVGEVRNSMPPPPNPNRQDGGEKGDE